MSRDIYLQEFFINHTVLFRAPDHPAILPLVLNATGGKLTTGIVYIYYSKLTAGVNDTSCRIFPEIYFDRGDYGSKFRRCQLRQRQISTAAQ